MEYIKKEELIIGEIYNCANISGSKYIVKIPNDLYNSTNINKDVPRLYKMGNFTTETLQWSLATPEEKHWLESCITADKFITFEEAMKSFIPEYVELLPGWSFDGEFVGEIFDTKKDFQEQFKKFKFVSKHADWKEVLRLNWIPKFFKPSTKEAYDAQFVVKEPEFVLPKLWCIKLTNENQKTVINYINKNTNDDERSGNIGMYYGYNGVHCTCIFNTLSNTEITFDQFKKYVLKEEIVEEKVIKPLPQFKIIETIETITKVENNEGNQFFINDKIKVSLNMVQKIISFSYNEDKTEIFANFNQNLLISINDIEHYIEPKVEVEETLLEKAKRLYPIGTEYICAYSGRTYNVSSQNFEQISNSKIHAENLKGCLLYEDKWAEIIE